MRTPHADVRVRVVGILGGLNVHTDRIFPHMHLYVVSKGINISGLLQR